MPSLNDFQTPRRFVPITFSDTVNLLPGIKALRCKTAGTFAIVDELDNVELVTLAANEEFIFSPKRINLTGSTGTIVGII